MVEVESTSHIEFSNDFRDRALNTANTFLSSPDVAVVKEEDFMASNIENRTILKTIDASTNTAFHIENGYAAGSRDPNSKKTVISWHTLGEDKGELPSGSIEILESGGEKKIFAYKMDNSLVTDQGYLWGVSRDVVDRTDEMGVRGEQVAISEEQAAQILTRLQSSQANKEYTEVTARIMDAEYRFTEALVEFQSVNKGNSLERVLRRSKIDAARKKLTETAINYKEVEEDIDEKRKKEIEKLKKKAQGQEEPIQ